METNYLFKQRVLSLFAVLFCCAAFVYAWPLVPKQDKKGRWGYVDGSGEWVIKARYDSAASFDGNVAMVAKDGLHGLVNGKGKEVLKCKYSMLVKIDEENYLAREAQDKWIGYDAKNDDDYKLSDVEFDNVGHNNTIITFTVDLGWLYTGNMRYVKTGIFMNMDTGRKYASDFTEYNKLGPNVYLLTYKGKNGKQVMKAYMADGKLLMDGVDSQQWKSGGYVSLKSSSSQLPVFISSDGEILKVKDDINSSFIVENPEGKCGVLANGTLNMKIPFEYEEIKSLGNDGFYVKKDGLWGYIPENGGQSVPCRYSGMSYVEGNGGNYVFIVTRNGKKGVIDKAGAEMLPCEYDDITEEKFYHGYLFIHKDGTVGIYDRYNKNILVETGKYSGISERTPGAFLVAEQNGREGVLDKTGRLIIPCMYKQVTRNNLGGPDTYTVWDDNGNFGICNESGKLIIPCGKYDRVKAFENYAIIVQNGKKIGAVKYDGTQFAPVVYDDYMNGFRNMAFAKNTMTGGTMYVYTLNGKFVTSKTFRNSDTWRIRNFVQDYLM